MCLVVSDETLSASLLFLRAFCGRFHTDACPIVITTSFAHAHDIAPLGKKKCIGRKVFRDCPPECFYIRTAICCTL